MSTISTSGIAPSSVIRAEHVLRIINALSNVSTNDILISGSLVVTGSTALSGSLRVTGGITGSIFGTSSNATSASYALNATNASTASYALTASYAVSASYEINYETSSSYANDATSASYALNSTNTVNATSASRAISSSYTLNSTNAAAATSASYSTVAQTLLGSVVSSSYALTASYALNSPGGGTTNTGSLLLTASATNNVITFTKGDASTFNITVNTGSASSINTGSFATTGSNQFSGSQGITGSITVADNDLSLAMNQNFIVFENLNSPNDIGTITRFGSTYSKNSNTQAFLFPSDPTGGYKTITLPNDNGTVALTYNTATTGSNTFTGNQTINANLILSASKTMSIVGPLAETYVTEGQISISPNYSGADQATLSGGSLNLSKANGTSTVVLTNRNSPATSGDHLASLTFRGKTSDINSGIKGGIRATTAGGTGSYMSLNLYTSASGFGGSFTSGDLDMRISSGSSIELFRNTTVTGSVSITNVLTLAPNDPLPSAQPTGSIAVSGSGVDCKPYFWNGTTWTSMI
jgi:hypothetical protein